MNKADLINQIAESATITKATAGKVVQSIQKSIAAALQEGENVTLIGFGTFSVKERAARTGRNPQTGEEIQIPAKKVVKFKVGKNLADRVKK
jgi:DNA-binding protein HU-beta